MEQKKDQLDEQETKPHIEQEGLQESNQNRENIINGALETDQLDKFKENVTEGGRAAYPERQEGAEPSEGDQ